MNGNEKLQSFDRELPVGSLESSQDSKPPGNIIARLFQNTKGARTLRGLFAKDQDQVRADLATFFGPRSDVYLAIYEKMRSNSGNAGFSWNWAVFFGGFVWFFYRRMYIWGAALILLPVILAVLYPSIATYVYIPFAGSAKSLYVHGALKRIGRADQLGLTGAERSEYLRRAGGVSLTAGIVTGLLGAVFVTFAIYGAFLNRHPVG